MYFWFIRQESEWTLLNRTVLFSKHSVLGNCWAIQLFNEQTQQGIFSAVLYSVALVGRTELCCPVLPWDEEEEVSRPDSRLSKMSRVVRVGTIYHHITYCKCRVLC